MVEIFSFYVNVYNCIDDNKNSYSFNYDKISNVETKIEKTLDGATKENSIKSVIFCNNDIKFKINELNNNEFDFFKKLTKINFDNKNTLKNNFTNQNHFMKYFAYILVIAIPTILYHYEFKMEIEPSNKTIATFIEYTSGMFWSLAIVSVVLLIVLHNRIK